MWQDDKAKRPSHGLNKPAFSIDHLLMPTQGPEQRDDMENSCFQGDTNANAP